MQFFDLYHENRYNNIANELRCLLALACQGGDVYESLI